MNPYDYLDDEEEFRNIGIHFSEYSQKQSKDYYEHLSPVVMVGCQMRDTVYLIMINDYY